jgi:hypothetical protein
MKTDNSFDRKLEAWGSRIPDGVRDAAVFVTDTMELCWAAAQAVFEEKDTAEAALAIYDRIRARMAEAPREAGIA